MLSRAPTGDEGAEAVFLDAVGRCRERLRAEGVDPVDYDVAAKSPTPTTCAGRWASTNGT